MNKIRVGIIGVGRVANDVHIPGLLACDNAEITAICDINENTLEAVGDKLNIPKDRRFVNYMDLINCSEVDAVEICTPNYLHVPFAVDAVKAGKPINVEKPLSISSECAAPLKKALEENPVANMICYSYRFRPAVRYAKWIVENKMLGDIVSMNVAYLQSGAFIKGRRLEWRFDKELSGSGALGDLGVHLLDLAEFLGGKLKEVTADCGTVVKKRQRLDSDEYADVNVDDHCNFIAKMESGAVANFSVTKCAIGHSNTIRFDVFGTNGTLSFDLNNPDILNVCVGEIDVKCGQVHTVNVPREFFVEQERTFIDMVENKDCPYLPTVEDGLRGQRILDAILKAAAEKKWVNVD